jgi:hypothetical protein
MKNFSIVLFLLFFATTIKISAQSAATTPDFYAGKWDISVIGSPKGDVIFATNLVRKDGKLTGELVSGEDKRPITKVEESATTLVLYFMSSQAGEINVTLEKVDANNLKGNLMGYTASAVRIKDADFFAGKWAVTILGTPEGDRKVVATLTRKDGKLSGELSDAVDPQKEKTPITNIEEEAGKITLSFSASGYDLKLPLEKVDNDNLKGKLMDMFDSTAVRIK